MCTRRTLEGSTSCGRECGGVQGERRKSRKGMKEAGKQKCSPILTRLGGCKTLWGAGAPERGDVCLLEDGGEREGALVSDLVIEETANEGHRAGKRWESKLVNGR